jgi:diguanylate cyclase (GGDEF)-like protein
LTRGNEAKTKTAQTALMLSHPTAFLEQRSKSLLIIFGLALFAAVALVDRAVDWQIDTSVFYLLPISYFAWYFSSKTGIFFAFTCVLVGFAVDHLKGPHYTKASIPYWNAAISLVPYLVVIFIVDDVKAIYRRERENSRLDFLTGMINQRGFYEALRRERERASRLNSPLTLAYVDLDNFKLVNDQFDHRTGDSVLATVGQTLRRSIRNIDLAGRLGGDEFCLLLPNTDSEGARILLEKVKDVLLGVMKASHWPVTFSIGAVTFLQSAKAAAEMINIADRAMYAAKTQGKNRIMYSIES